MVRCRVAILVEWLAVGVFTLGCSAGGGAKASRDGGADGGAEFSPDRCLGAWRIVFQSAPAETPPARGDLAWRAGTLFVKHAAYGASSPWLFSIADHGGSINSLNTQGLRHFWLEGDNLIYVELNANNLDSIPQAGGSATQILRFADSPIYGPQSPDLVTPVALDGTALYWFEVTGGPTAAFRHFRGGGTDNFLANVASVPGSSGGWLEQAEGQLIVGSTSITGAGAVSTIPKAGGSAALLPAPDAPYVAPLAASTDGALLWISGTPDGTGREQYQLQLGNVDGTMPTAFSTTMPATIAPTAGWAAANQSWYLATYEFDSHMRPYVSIWSLAADGAAKRLACYEATDTGASGDSTTLAHVTAGVVADGAFYASLGFSDGTWLIGGIDNAAAAPDVGDAGMAAPDGDFGAAACKPGAPPLGAAAAAHTFTEIPVPNPDSGLEQITLGPDGNLWFTESNALNLGRVTPTGCLTEFPAGDSSSTLTTAPDGALWFTHTVQPVLGRMTVAGAVQNFSLSDSDNAEAVVTGPDGNLWFTVPLASAVGRMTTAGTTTEFRLPNNFGTPSGITTGTDGMLWVVAQPSLLVRVDPSNGAMTKIHGQRQPGGHRDWPRRQRLGRQRVARDRGLPFSGEDGRDPHPVSTAGGQLRGRHRGRPGRQPLVLRRQHKRHRPDGPGHARGRGVHHPDGPLRPL